MKSANSVNINLDEGPHLSERLLGRVSVARDLTDFLQVVAIKWVQRLLISVGFLFLRIFLNLVRSLFVLLADFVELLHVLKELGAALESDEKLGFLAVISVVGGGLHVNGLCPDRLEGGVLVSRKQSEYLFGCAKHTSPAASQTIRGRVF